MLYGEKADFISDVKVYPYEGGLRVKVELDVSHAGEGVLRISTDALCQEHEEKVRFESGRQVFSFEYHDLSAQIKKWDEYEGNLYELTVNAKIATQDIQEKKVLEKKMVTFGFRTVENLDGHFAVNAHRVFVRSEANCCVFADTGHMPLTKEEWLAIFLQYKEYGINLVRFHSHCPPKQAFYAADELGMMVQPELSNWDPRDAFGEPYAEAYYRLEMEQILRFYGNHPSFVALSFGNELTCLEKGQKVKESLLREAKQLDSTRMYIGSSNGFYGMKGVEELDDYYTSANYYEEWIRGTNSDMRGAINEQAPDTCKNYSPVIRKIWEQKKVPVISFEVGQFEILPDFKEIEQFQGVTLPNNIISVRDKVTQKGFLKDWEKRVEATGELAFIAYREEIESVLRTPEMSGISLLGLQDFLGQGTALVGMLNSHLKPKQYPFSRSDRWRDFFAPKVLLAKIPKYTYLRTETLPCEIVLANYSKACVGGELSVVLKREKDGEIVFCQTLQIESCESGKLQQVADLEILLDVPKLTGNCKCSLELCLKESSTDRIQQNYPVWVYDEDECASEILIPENEGYAVFEKNGKTVFVTQSEEIMDKLLKEGKNVFYTPKAEREHFRNAIKTQFTTDFWSVGTFPTQEGYMGCMPAKEHPLYRYFPTEDHANWQWWQLTNAYAFEIPDETEPLLEVLDSYAYLRKLAFLVEGKRAEGRLVISSLGLLEKQQYPEIRAFLYSVLSYMTSDSFEPKQQLDGILRA